MFLEGGGAISLWAISAVGQLYATSQLPRSLECACTCTCDCGSATSCSGWEGLIREQLNRPVQTADKECPKSGEWPTLTIILSLSLIVFLAGFCVGYSVRFVGRRPTVPAPAGAEPQVAPVPAIQFSPGSAPEVGAVVLRCPRLPRRSAP